MGSCSLASDHRFFCYPIVKPLPQRLMGLQDRATAASTQSAEGRPRSNLPARPQGQSATYRVRRDSEALSARACAATTAEQTISLHLPFPQSLTKSRISHDTQLMGRMDGGSGAAGSERASPACESVRQSSPSDPARCVADEEANLVSSPKVELEAFSAGSDETRRRSFATCDDSAGSRAALGEGGQPRQSPRVGIQNYSSRSHRHSRFSSPQHPDTERYAVKRGKVLTTFDTIEGTHARNRRRSIAVHLGTTGREQALIPRAPRVAIFGALPFPASAHESEKRLAISDRR